MKYADGIDWLNNGNGFTKQELRDAIVENRNSELSIDETLGNGDLATSEKIIESLLNRIDELESICPPEDTDKVNFHTISWTMATNAGKNTSKFAAEQAVSLMVTAVENAYYRYFGNSMFETVLQKGRYSNTVNEIRLISPSIQNKGKFVGEFDRLILTRNPEAIPGSARKHGERSGRFSATEENKVYTGTVKGKGRCSRPSDNLEK